MDHECSVDHLFLPPSPMSASSSGSRFPSACNDGLGTIRMSRMSACARKMVFPFHEYVMAFESFDVKFHKLLLLANLHSLLS